MTLLRSVIIMCALLVTQLGAAAPEHQDKLLSHSVAMSIEYGGRIVGTPKLELIEGQAAIMAVERVNGYSLRIVLSRVTKDGAQRARVETELYLEQQGKWVPVASPVVIAPFGGIASYELPGRSAAHPSLRIGYEIGVPRAIS